MSKTRKEAILTKKQRLQAGRIVILDPRRVKPFADQPRKRFRGIPKLAESIRAVGQVTPIVVTACQEPGYDAELVDGERRLRACLFGKMPVRAVVETRQHGGVIDRYIKSVAANFCRQSHDAVEVMEAVLTLKRTGKTREEIAAIFGKTVAWVAQHSSLAKLAPAVLEELKVAGDEMKLTRKQQRKRGRLTLSVALLLVALPHDQQIKALRMIQAGKLSMVAARNAVHRLAASRGAQVGKNMTWSSKFRAVETAVGNCACVIERWLTMPGAEIRSLVNAATPKERTRLAEKLETLCEQLLMLSDEMDTVDRQQNGRKR